MSRDSRFAPGQRVNVQIDGRQVGGVFVRVVTRGGGVNAKGAAAAAAGETGGRADAIGWVRRSDTGEVEPFEFELISGA